ncbi:MAG: GyrI-like domain-containing protein, partial [Pseudoflavonifractor capillosus]|uniref:GyrI-like domain-containing protein n=1 Tax=Pseudoflavonifractor capillosus TaxID=106588 RepID=UPI0023F7CE3F
QSTDFIPDGLEPLNVDAADYAVFLVPPGNGNMTLLNENVRRMWKYIFGEWLPQNKNYRTAEGKIDLEVYHSGRTSLYVPVSRV